MNQHNVELGDTVDENPFVIAIKNAKKNNGDVVAIQDNIGDGAKYTLGRGWCMLEMQVTLMNQLPLYFVCSNGAIIAAVAGGASKNLLQDKQCTAGWKQHMESWKAETALGTVWGAKDQNMIKDYIFEHQLQGQQGLKQEEEGQLQLLQQVLVNGPMGVALVTKSTGSLLLRNARAVHPRASQLVVVQSTPPTPTTLQRLRLHLGPLHRRLIQSS